MTPPDGPLLHIGATSIATHCRRLSADLLRLRLVRPLPLRVGDRALLRDPGSRAVWGVTVLDPAPPSIKRRGAAAERSSVLASVTGEPDLASEVERRGVVHTSTLDKIGVPMSTPGWLGINAAGWLMSVAKAAEVSREIRRLVSDQARRSPLDPGVPLVALAERLGLPSPELVRAVVHAPLHVADGRVLTDSAATLSPALERAVESIHGELTRGPFLAPTSDRLRELGLDHRAVAAAARAGRLLRVADGIVLLPGADNLAVEWLTALPQPFTTSQARVRLGTSRRVVLPLLAHLDKAGRTRRLPDDRRVVVS